ncbi:MAG: phosphoribosylaminoimidazolesuccinocarboxamide synthase [Methylococcales bacterium]|nr:phosphoribosylaminoimidazolesuccinocarboxamide synthase [Methylococcales bacterium]
MTSPLSLYHSHLPKHRLIARGKVRDIYELDDQHLLMVTTDRLSAFDVVLPDPIPGKGEVLTQISLFWFKRFQDVIPNHLTCRDITEISTDPALAQRAVIVKKLKPLPIEAIVRGYLIGSGWKDYQATGKVCGIDLPKGLVLASPLPEPLFTPSTKALEGSHDENIDFAQATALLGETLASQVRDISLTLYRQATDYALARGIIIADTKFEFGLDDNGHLHLIDEVLTPDSSRFWPQDAYRAGHNPPSFDKQFVRDYLETLDWNKQAPGPTLPPIIIEQTAQRYREAQRRLTGNS